MPIPYMINTDRFQADFHILAQIGKTAGGGVNRPTFSPAHLEARNWFASTALQRGLEFRQDSAGNHSAFLPCGIPGGPTLLLGSHLDSVPNGGRFDGALGVTAAIEVLCTIKEAGLTLPFHLEAVDFTDEEGTLVGLLGSSALAGTLSAGDLQKPRGGRQALVEGLERAGLSEAWLPNARRDPASLAGYLELHIEQGPRLLNAGAEIGIVTDIVGIGSYRVIFHGQPNHAGTTPMDARRDASLGAARFILDVHEQTRADFPGCVATVGAARFEPGAFNIVPGQVELALEYRSAEQLHIKRLEQALLELAADSAKRYELELETLFLGQHDPAPMSPQIQQVCAAAAEDLGLAHLSLASGAGHDAQSLASVCPAGMIFVPSVDGASHSPREFTHWVDCVNGANVLLGAVLGLANLNE